MKRNTTTMHAACALNQLNIYGIHGGAPLSPCQKSDKGTCTHSVCSYVVADNHSQVLVETSKQQD